MPLMMRFVELVEDPVAHTRSLARFAGLEPPEERIEEAAAFVKRR
jgi:hypothetical protein